MHGICNSVSDPLNVRYVLDYIDADTNYLNIYSHIYVQCRKQNRDKPTTNAKENFPKFCKVYTGQNQTHLIHYIYI